MATRLSAKFSTALVTGSSSGLGAAFTDMLLAEGVRVIGTSRSPERLSAKANLEMLPLDLGDADSRAAFLESMAARWPEVDLLINNAGAGAFGAFEGQGESVVSGQIEILLEAPLQICRAALPPFVERESGTIVNVSSLVREFPMPYFALYNAAKAGLSNFSRSLDLDLARNAVRVIDFQPGDYRTRFNQQSQQPPERSEREKKAWRALDAHMEAAPAPERAARDLRRALRRNRSGTVVSGDFFQARFAPFAARCATWPLLRRILLAYYRL